MKGIPAPIATMRNSRNGKKKIPIPRLEQKLLEMKILTQSKIEEIKGALQNDLAAAEQFAEESPFPDVSELTADVYS